MSNRCRYCYADESQAHEPRCCTQSSLGILPNGISPAFEREVDAKMAAERDREPHRCAACGHPSWDHGKQGCNIWGADGRNAYCGCMAEPPKPAPEVARDPIPEAMTDEERRATERERTRIMAVIQSRRDEWARAFKRLDRDGACTPVGYRWRGCADALDLVLVEIEKGAGRDE